ncbi:glycosyltransferase family 4 protein [Flavobacteriaceae bacterium]|nr:glycosyltransferase family 4 protein [Flavobacteriaceae bacterium]
MKIAFLTPEYPHPQIGGSGGIGSSIKYLARGLTQMGHKVTILLYQQPIDEVIDDSGVTIQRIKNVKFKGLSWWLTRKKLERIINQCYNSGKIEIVEAPDWTGITSFIKPKKCPVVIRLNGSDTYFCNIENRPSKWINRFHERRALKNAQGIISVSHFTGVSTEKIFNLPLDFRVIHNGIDVDEFTPQEVSGEQSQILYYGTLIRKKGVLELPGIFNIVHKSNPSVELLLVGNDSADIFTGSSSTWSLMQPLFDATALKNVKYLGVMSPIDLRTQISKASVCVFPSFAEAFPLSWLEAMAMEKAVVASNIGWGKEMIESGFDGFLGHPKDHNRFAELIISLIKNPRQRLEVGKNARQTVLEKFSHQIIAEQSLKFYESI